MHIEKPTVFIVDDDEKVCESLRWLVESADLKGECYTSAQDFLANYHPQRPGCLLLDVRLPTISGLDLHQWLVAQDLSIPVIIITGYGDVSMAVHSMKRGAFDFIEKPYSDQLLLERVQQAIEQDNRIRQEQIEQQRTRDHLLQLTPREFEIMTQLVEGKSNKVIAHELGLTYKTVGVYRSRVMAKMQAENMVELVHMALVCGILPDSPEDIS